MQSTSSTVRTLLAEAMTRKRLVRVHRRLEDGVVDGFVVGVDRQWMLLLLVGEGIRYDGFQAFRLRDIVSVDSPSPRDAFYRRVLSLRQLRRPPSPRLDLSSTETLIRSAGRRFPLVTIHRELADP